MKAVAQRVSHAAVRVDGQTVGEIGNGFLVLVGVAPDDTSHEGRALVEKVVGLRVFSDADGRMNLSVRDVGGSVLVVSQFTLLAEIARGRRPSFTGAAPPEVAEPLVDEIVSGFAAAGVDVATGSFGAKMEVSLVNDGPVTIVFDVTSGKVA